MLKTCWATSSKTCTARTRPRATQPVASQADSRGRDGAHPPTATSPQFLRCRMHVNHSRALRGQGLERQADTAPVVDVTPLARVFDRALEAAWVSSIASAPRSLIDPSAAHFSEADEARLSDALAPPDPLGFELNQLPRRRYCLCARWFQLPSVPKMQSTKHSHGNPSPAQALTAAPTTCWSRFLPASQPEQ